MKELAQELDNKIEIEAYIGNFNNEEVKQISEHIDRLLVHDYIKNPNRNFIYVFMLSFKIKKQPS